MKSFKKIKFWAYVIIPTLLLSSVVLLGNMQKIKQITKFSRLGINHITIRPIKKTKFSDEVLIKSAIYRLKQSVKNQDQNLFERSISKDIIDSTGSVNGNLDAIQKFVDLVKNQDMSFRSKYSQRRTPKLQNIKPTWDFEIDIIDVKIIGNSSKATVTSYLYFAMDQPDDDIFVQYAKKPKKVKEKFEMVKKNGKWKIKKIYKFFKFMEDRKKV